jgi:hypothetical protein
MNFIYSFHFGMAKSLFKYQKFCNYIMCRCGAVVECDAEDLRNTKFVEKYIIYV